MNGSRERESARPSREDLAPYFDVRPRRGGWGEVRIPTFPPGLKPHHSLAAVRPLLILTTISWIAVGSLLALSIRSFALPLTTLIGAGAALVIAIVLTYRLSSSATDLLHQARALWLLRRSARWGGLSVGFVSVAALTLLEEPGPTAILNAARAGDVGGAQIMLAVTMASAIIALSVVVRAISAVRQAFSDQMRIATLRATGERSQGILSIDSVCTTWVFDRPQLGGVVDLIPRNSRPPIAVRLWTTSERVPLTGSHVTVFSDGVSSHVDIDVTQPVLFYPPERFAAPSD